MITLAHEIAAVTLYDRGATVHRRAQEAEVPAGRVEVELAGLPLGLDDDSVRVLLPGDPAGVDLASVRVALTVLPRGEAPESPGQAELREVERQLQRLELQRHQLAWEIDALVAVPTSEARPGAFEDRPPPSSPMPGRIALEALLDQATSERRAELRELDAELSVARERAVDLRDRLARASAGRAARPEELTKAVRLALVTAAPTVITLELAYFCPGARWAPAWQVWLSGEEARISLRALVAQSTGEDWRGARLSLCTASPQQWQELPVLSAIRIGRAQTGGPPAPRLREPPPGAEALFADFDRDRSAFSLTGGRAPPPARAAVRPLEILPSPVPMEELALDDAAVSMETTFAPPPAPAPAMAGVAAPGPQGGAAPAIRSKRQRGPVADDAPRPPQPAPRPSFGSLTLADPVDARRGRLVHADRRSAWRAELATAGRQFAFDPISAAEQARGRAAVAAELPLPPGASDVRQTVGRFDYTWRTELPVDVPSDGGWHSIPVEERTAPVRVHHVVVPREDVRAWRIASLENPLRSPMLPGPCEVFVDGEFVVATAMAPVAPRERFQLGLGVEPAIRVARNTRFTEKRAGTKVVATSELWHDIEISLLSHLPRATSCQVRERIPVAAKDAEVVVEEGEVDPGWFPYYQDEAGTVIHGGRRWEIELPPGKEVVLSAAYVVKIYANHQLVGGNRRET